MSRMRLAKQGERKEFRELLLSRNEKKKSTISCIRLIVRKTENDMRKYFHSHAIDMDKPRPCDHCGCDNIQSFHNYWDSGRGFYYKCGGCGCQTGGENSDEEALKAWNTRISDKE